MRHCLIYLRRLSVLALPLLLIGCEYAGHTVKAQMGRKVGETVAGTEYTVGCEVRFDRRGR